MAAAVNSAPPTNSLDARCGQQPPAVILAFQYRDGRTTDVPIADYLDCPSAVAFLGGRPRILDSSVGTDIVAMASFELPNPEGPGAAPGPVPSFYGQPGAIAIAHAADAGFQLQFGGEEVDPAVAVGAVVMEDPPPGSFTIGNEVDVVIAVPTAPECHTSALAITLSGAEPGAGSDFGTFTFQDTSPTPCTLVGPVVVTGLDSSGKADTETRSFPVPAGMVLLPGPPATAGTLPITEVVAELTISAEYRDDATGPDGLCQPSNQVQPTSWDVSSAEGTWAIDNLASRAGAMNFLTCRGEINGATRLEAA